MKPVTESEARKKLREKIRDKQSSRTGVRSKTDQNMKNASLMDFAMMAGINDSAILKMAQNTKNLNEFIQKSVNGVVKSSETHAKIRRDAALIDDEESPPPP